MRDIEVSGGRQRSRGKVRGSCMGQRALRRTRVLMSAAVGVLICALTPPVASGSSAVTSITVTQVSIYAGWAGTQVGGIVVFQPAQPGLEGCTYAPGNELWIDFSSTSQPDGKALY